MRAIQIFDRIDDHTYRKIVPQLLEFEKQDPLQPIILLVHSLGGALDVGFAIVDIMDFLKCPIHTYAKGQTDALATLILARGTKGCRNAFREAEFSLGRFQFVLSKNPRSRVCSRELVRAEESYVRLLAEATRQHPARIQKDMQTEITMDATGAKSYGLIDTVLSSEQIVQFENDLGDICKGQ